ncbi:hypothetical protein FHQ28_02870 [Pasteurellaceae bacterium USgator11]|nr:hypothetical protein FHQ20_09405 [Pasteurellaceae bacterium USgator41]TNG94828.1 hypothetical protein FHQ19_06260 [Pasteurellaceae bacterium UScroc12]TNH00238.1 hypothetical protein FHQ24_04090 [Pasteurellaceae bacterium UScroc31]TNH02484.1 hypothetical protein FHQ28_02870 [Pasteurellaceae bacterium USgator11]
MKKPQKFQKMVKVDAYLIPESEAEQYIADRTLTAQRLEKAMLTFCERIEYGGKGSEDGEFITGIDQHGEYQVLMHLSPEEIEMVKSCATEAELVALLKAQ